MKNVLHIGIVMALFVGSALAAPAVVPFDNPSPVNFERYQSYFERDDSGLTGPSSYLILEERPKFEKVFGVAATTGTNSFLSGNAFDTRFIFAIIKRGAFTAKYGYVSVMRDFDKLRIYVDATYAPKKNATFRTPLILAIDKADFDYSQIVVTENDKEVFKVDLTN